MDEKRLENFEKMLCAVQKDMKTQWRRWRS